MLGNVDDGASDYVDDDCSGCDSDYYTYGAAPALYNERLGYDSDSDTDGAASPPERLDLMMTSHESKSSPPNAPPPRSTS